MAKVKVNEDCMGLWLSGGGYLSRPLPTLDKPCFASRFKVGDTVKAHHHGGSTFITVKSLDNTITEEWYTHNFVASFYKKLKKIMPEELFNKYVAFEASEQGKLDFLGKNPIHEEVKPYLEQLHR